MYKKTSLWNLNKLEDRFAAINFPEFQREPNVWLRIAKQRLIDSIVRDFDIASFYLYHNKDGTYDCVDGRQRLNAIMSFLAKNPEDEDDGFEFRVLNEIFTDEPHPFAELEGKTYAGIVEEDEKANKVAKQFLTKLQQYEVTIVELAQSERAEEFNLQFTRLNLGTIINSGEKLHAMVGAMREICFGKAGLGHHAFLAGVSIPTRRYSKEQVAAQILAQVFSVDDTGEVTRTRHFDLQKFFKDHAKLTDAKTALVKKVRGIFDVLSAAFTDLGLLSNRAIIVSTVLLAKKINVTKASVGEFTKFIEEFLCRLSWQIKKGVDFDTQYRYLLDFQRHVTQASVEKPAVQFRAQVLDEQYKLWKAQGVLRGDKDYKKEKGVDPSKECRKNQAKDDQINVLL